MENRLIDSLRRADRFWLLDGAMGTQLQKKLVAAGRSILGLIPELCCITEPELVTQVHREYLEAGADILYTNTFGANRKKLTGSGYTPQQIIPAAVGCAKQTLTGSERYITQELKELEQQILGAKDRILVLENNLFDQLRQQVAVQIHRVQATANAIAWLDLYASFAAVALEQNYCRPDARPPLG